jgi:hypothetical protein
MTLNECRTGRRKPPTRNPPSHLGNVYGGGGLDGSTPTIRLGVRVVPKRVVVCVWLCAVRESGVSAVRGRPIVGTSNSLRKRSGPEGRENVEVGGRGGWVRGRAMAGPEGRESRAVRVRIAVLVRCRTGTRIMRKAFSNTY